MKNRLYIILILVVFLGACAPYQSKPQYEHMAGWSHNMQYNVETNRRPGLIEAVASIPQEILFGRMEKIDESVARENGVTTVSQSSTFRGNCMTLPGSNGICLPIYGGYQRMGTNFYAGSRGWGLRSRWRVESNSSPEKHCASFEKSKLALFFLSKSLYYSI